MSKKVKFTVECEMEERWKDYFLSFLKTMEFFGQAGHSELLGFYSDGDGDFRLSRRFFVCLRQGRGRYGDGAGRDHAVV